MLKNKGFTLIEVLIALAIVAIALTAIVKASSYDVEDLSYLQQKTLANWVAQNVLAQVQLKLIPASGQNETTLMNQEFFWTLNTESTPDKNIEKIIVTVAEKANAHPIIKIWGFQNK